MQGWRGVENKIVECVNTVRARVERPSVEKVCCAVTILANRRSRLDRAEELGPSNRS